MNLGRRVRILLKTAALWAGMATAVLCMALAGLGFLSSAMFIWLSRHTGPAAAAAITGAVLLALALFTGLVAGTALKRVRRRQRSLASELAGTFGIARLVGLLVRRDPKKALIFALVAGAMAEYVLGEKGKSK
jgi:hypothetical protein